MAISPFMAAINQICDQKGLPKDVVIETVEAAIAAAYRKEFGKPQQIIRARLNPETAAVLMSQVFEVVDEIEDENSQMILKEAKKLRKNAKVGEEVEIPLEAKTEFGRIAAQTAKQVITQRIREAERTILFEEFKEKEGDLLNGVVQQIEGDNVIIDLGKLNGIMPPPEQMQSDRCYVGQRLKVFVKQVEETNKGPRVLVSRTDAGLISGLFTLEVPEITAQTVEIKGIAREAASRTKIAVIATQEGLDPVGSCVGQRGTRVQAVLAEIGEEKIDIILWDEAPEQYIINALSPAKVQSVKTDQKNQKAIVYVQEDQLSLAIGKGGQNVRLASKLTGWNLDIEKALEEKEEKIKKAKKEVKEKKEEKPKDKTKKPAVKNKPKEAKKKTKTTKKK
jgi:N utilization substance protein A